MSDSSPADLAIVFRALPRRLREAQGDVPAATIGGPLGEIEALVARAARLVHSPSTDPGLVASAIEAVPADAWGSELDELRAVALELGKQLRAVAAANPDLAD